MIQQKEAFAACGGTCCVDSEPCYESCPVGLARLPADPGPPKVRRTARRRLGTKVPRAWRGGLWLVWALAALATLVGLAGLDRTVYELSLAWRTPNPVDQDFYARTHYVWEGARVFGSLVGGVVVYFLVWLLDPRGWRKANCGLAAVLIAMGVAMMLKYGFGRVRPNHADTHLAFVGPVAALHTSQGLSFPSGEAVTAFGIATVLAVVFPRGRTLFYGLAVCTATARVVGGAHYPSDVIVGAMVGVWVSKTAYAWLEARSDRVDALLYPLARRSPWYQSPRASRSDS